MSEPDTIFALSSGMLPAAIAVVRISGPRTRFVLETMVGRVPTSRVAMLATVREPETRQPIDQALVLWFEGPASETGEDVAEFQLHGGRAVLAATLKALGSLPGLRPAEAGEFTRRAFENGQLDLTRVEGLADLVGAETEAQRRQAFRQLTGLLGNRAQQWRKQLIDALALIEAGIDFSDEGDVSGDLIGPALREAAALRSEIAAALADGGRGERLREGLSIAVLGPPNAGKSTLFNRLARRDVAIVSATPGTTRDVLELHLDLDGFPATMVDTAGIRQSADAVEQEGIRRALARAEQADLVLWVVEALEPAEPPDHGSGDRWLIRNKIDTIDSAKERPADPQADDGFSRSFAISAQTGQGVDALVQALADYAAQALAGSEPAVVTRQRHRSSLERVGAALDRASALGPEAPPELLAEELRVAATELGRLVGRVDVEDVLDAIFRDFCIGK